MYYGLIFYVSGALCPLSGLLMIALSTPFILMFFYSNKSFTLFFLSEETTTVDLLGFNLFFMTWILTLGCLLTILLSLNWASNLFISLIFMSACSAGVYFSLQVLEFYINFELSLFPIVFMILGWGYQPERFSASLALFLYTLMGSLPFLVFLVYLNNYDLKMFSQICQFMSYSPAPSALALIISMAFLIKLPMFLVHSWLPKAHVEAPVYGSMFLAGTLLKLGALGLFRIMSFMTFSWSSLLSMLSLIAMFLVSILCLLATDMKILIAYSSVVHMGLALVMVLSLTFMSFNSGMMIFITHGLSSSMMFLMAYLIYTRSNSRSLLTNQNLLILSPLMTSFWFFSSVGMMGGPPASTLLSELLGFSCMTASWFPSMMLLIPSAFLGGLFSMTLFTRTAHGAQNLKLVNQLPFNTNEFMVTGFHSFWLMVYFLFFSWLMLLI